MPRQQFESHDADCPPIHCIGVALALDDLRCEVVRRAASSVGLADDELGKTHVRNLDAALVRDQYVLWLEIPVDDMPLVAVVESEDHAGNIELGMSLQPIEALAAISGMKLAPHCRLHKQVERFGAVVRLKKLDDENRVQLEHDVSLPHHALLHAHLHDEALAQGLHCVALAADLVLEELHVAKSTTTEKTDFLQVLLVDPLSSGILEAGVLTRDAESLYRCRILELVVH
mmetsp:Transcript_34183/g.72767  ORF Transcript_34183/g.72767 Transcript_34183/m.72767 type:complete len:230 (+) Transcript_34183:661-1350(+)